MRANDPILSLPRYGVWVRLTVAGPGGVFSFNPIELTSIAGKDSLFEASWGEDLDQPCASGTIRLARKVAGQSLSPLMSTGISGGNPQAKPPLWPGNSFVLETSCDAPGAGPANWRHVLKGRIDEVDPNSDDKTVAISVRDDASIFVEQWIEDARTISEGPVVQVLQGILDFAYPFTGGAPSPDYFNTYIYAPPPLSDWVVREYTQEKMSLMEALRTIALQQGYDFRVMYQDQTLGPNIFVPTFYNPDRALSRVDAVMGPRDYFSIKGMPISRVDIRNRIRIRYFNSSAGEWQEVFVEDIDSGIQYGPRFMQLAEAQSTNIDTSFEANTMGQAALADLKDPSFTHQIERRYFWPVQLNDIHTYEANGEHYDTDQTLAVASIQHTLSPSTQRTTIGTRGKPAAALRNWFDKPPKTTYIHTQLPSGNAQEDSVWYRVLNLDPP